jgi:hypothetical protein
MVFIPWIFHQCAQNSGGVMIVLLFLETGMVIVSRRNRNYSSIIELYIGAEIFCKCGFRKGVLHVFFRIASSCASVIFGGQFGQNSVSSFQVFVAVAPPGKRPYIYD